MARLPPPKPTTPSTVKRAKDPKEGPLAPGRAGPPVQPSAGNNVTRRGGAPVRREKAVDTTAPTTAAPETSASSPKPALLPDVATSIDEALRKVFPTEDSDPTAVTATESAQSIGQAAMKTLLTVPLPSLENSGGTPVPTSAAAAAALLSDADRAAARATLSDLAAEHVRPVRSLMLELQWGGSAVAWTVAARGALSSLRRMAEQIEMEVLNQAISAFLIPLDHAVVNEFITEDLGRQLTATYAALVSALPGAFELEGDRDRREPLLVQSVLGQVPGLEPLMVQRLFAVGLGRLDSLLRATAEEVAVVADLPGPTAAALVAKAQELRRTGGGGGPPEITDAKRVLEPLVVTLKVQQQEYTRAAQGWSADNLAAKRRHRRDRELTFLKIKGAVARLGDVDFALRLQTYSFARRIDELEQYLQQAGGLARAS
jgi:hypothetical protein